MPNNNFYLNIPTALDENLVKWTGCKPHYFKHFYVKCGEAIKQTVKGRTNQEGLNTAGLTTLFKFYLPIDKIRNAYEYDERRVDHFDTLIFGQQHIKEEFKNTIFNYFTSKKIDCLPLNSTVRYGREYIDIADDFNLWLDENKDEVANIQAHPDAEMVYSVASRYLNAMMPTYLAEFAAKKLDYQVSKSAFCFRDYQKIIYDQIVKLLSDGILHITAELPPRWGKTMTMLKLFADCNEAKLLVVFSYVKTVNVSYRSAIVDTDFGVDMRFVDVNSTDNFKSIKSDIKTVAVINTACDADKCFAARALNLKKLIKKLNLKPEEVMYVNEEADFGNHTKKSAQKIANLGITDGTIALSVTGTDAYKVDKVFSNAHHIVVNLNDFNEIRNIGVNRKTN